jgi:hypothetical protein
VAQGAFRRFVHSVDVTESSSLDRRRLAIPPFLVEKEKAVAQDNRLEG